MTTVAPACWDDTSEAAHSYHTEMLLLSYCSFWLILFWSKVLLSLLRPGASYNISWLLCVTLRLDDSALPSHTHNDPQTHTPPTWGKKKEKNEKAVINQLRERMWPRVTS